MGCADGCVFSLAWSAEFRAHREMIFVHVSCPRKGWRFNTNALKRVHARPMDFTSATIEFELFYSQFMIEIKYCRDSIDNRKAFIGHLEPLLPVIERSNQFKISVAKEETKC